MHNMYFLGNLCVCKTVMSAYRNFTDDLSTCVYVHLRPKGAICGLCSTPDQTVT